MCQTTFLQELLDKRGTVVIPPGHYVVDRSLLVYDHTHIICGPDVTVQLAAEANCPIMINPRHPDGTPTVDVSIEGGTWDGNNTCQTRENYLHPEYPDASTYYGLGGALFVFMEIRNLCMTNLRIKDPEAYAVMLTAARFFTFRDIFFDFNNYRGNMDGIHVNGWAKDGYIGNLMGNTNDDMVALNSDEGDFYTPYCDIENITIENIYGGDNGWTAIRLLSRHANVRNISIRNVYGAYRYNAVSFTHWAEDDGFYGHFDQIVLENIFASSARTSGIGHGGLIWFQEHVAYAKKIILRNIMRIEGPEFLNDVPTISVGEEAHIELLCVHDAYQEIPDNKELMDIAPSATIDTLSMDANTRIHVFPSKCNGNH